MELFLISSLCGCRTWEISVSFWFNLICLYNELQYFVVRYLVLGKKKKSATSLPELQQILWKVLKHSYVLKWTKIHSLIRYDCSRIFINQPQKHNHGIFHTRKLNSADLWIWWTFLLFSIVIKIVNDNICEDDCLWSHISSVEGMVEMEVHFLSLADYFLLSWFHLFSWSELVLL